MSTAGDNPFNDGLDLVGCPPQRTDLRLPEFPEAFKGDCKLICWGRCEHEPDGIRRMHVLIENFQPTRKQCGEYGGQITFIDALTNEKWYTGKLRFYYTRNYLYLKSLDYRETRPLTAFRFVVKGDLERVSDKMPEWECLILCTKRSREANWYERAFVYGGFDLLFDVKYNEMDGFMLSLGHNDGWYTHHPECSKRPIKWEGAGDYVGHYSDRGWLFVSPGRNFVFNPGLKPPTGGFTEEALRRIDEGCLTEESIESGKLGWEAKRCIHTYESLEGHTFCKTLFESDEQCMGFVRSRDRHRFLTFFSMGYWLDRLRRTRIDLHLVEGKIRFRNNSELREPLYFYGFSTQNFLEELKLVDLADNGDIIGEPADTRALLYLYNAGAMRRNPKEPFVWEYKRLSSEIMRRDLELLKERAPCPFVKEVEKKE